ncbi:glycosyltransferase family 2 protein [Fodinibius sediminis]|uniref:Glycosyltransferase, GT2 family n=1 Tax=Fodinibius sediminis TaxID=1214077 RepID=A0A521EUN3_9BACT|nr:glycosyltransferase family A protein [Fodinibius sediminis]SMO87605.1 Glycosyltransferase, GT2 family [Fodinibius sediminis]
MDLSIIVIGRNEAEHLLRCLRSVQSIQTKEEVSSFEVIYIDSDSDDNSIEIARQEGIDKIIRITNFFNAAVARNIGAQHARFGSLIFLDGDMVLNKINMHQIQQYLEDENSIVRAEMKENIIRDGRVVKSYKRDYPKHLSGGAFIMKKAAYEKIGGMDNRFKKGQDYDFFIRAYELGYEMIVSNSFSCSHDTRGYRAKSNLMNIPFRAGIYRGLLFRKNLCSKITLRLMLYEYYPVLAFLTGICLFFLFQNLNLLYGTIGTLFILTIYKIRKEGGVRLFVTEIFNQFMMVISFFSFVPKKKETSVEII